MSFTGDHWPHGLASLDDLDRCSDNSSAEPRQQTVHSQTYASRAGVALDRPSTAHAPRQIQYFPVNNAMLGFVGSFPPNNQHAQGVAPGDYAMQDPPMQMFQPHVYTAGNTGGHQYIVIGQGQALQWNHHHSQPSATHFGQFYYNSAGMQGQYDSPGQFGEVDVASNDFPGNSNAEHTYKPHHGEEHGRWEFGSGRRRGYDHAEGLSHSTPEHATSRHPSVSGQIKSPFSSSEDEGIRSINHIPSPNPSPGAKNSSMPSASDSEESASLYQQHNQIEAALYESDGDYAEEDTTSEASTSRESSPEPAPRQKGRKEKPKLAPCHANSIQRAKDPVTGMYFSDYATVYHLKSMVGWKPPNPDPTIPALGEEQPVVKRIVSAILNNEDVKESNTTSRFRNRWADKATFYHPWDIEMAAWRVVHKARKLHTQGFSWPVFDRDQLKRFENTMDLTFEERIDLIVNLIKHSKHTCEDLLRGDKINAFIGAPQVYEGRTKTNHTSNLLKARRIALGVKAEKEAMEAKQKEEQLEDSKDRNVVDNEPREEKIIPKNKGKQKSGRTAAKTAHFTPKTPAMKVTRSDAARSLRDRISSAKATTQPGHRKSSKHSKVAATAPIPSKHRKRARDLAEDSSQDDAEDTPTQSKRVRKSG